MLKFTRTWWGQRFLTALEQFTDASRLARGRSYAHNGRILSYKITNGTVSAKVKGSINPYFDVYEAPTYNTKITIQAIQPAEWSKLISYISTRADLITKLLLKEMPDSIEDVFAELDLHLLPYSHKDFNTSCSCPDWSNPCKHIAGVYYLLASALDTDPFLMFELRGLSRDNLYKELTQSPLGHILADTLATETLPEPKPVTSFFTRPTKLTTPEVTSHKEFWTGAKRPPVVAANKPQVSVPAILIKTQGDYPAFWDKDKSFIATMEEVYERVRGKNKL